VYSVVTTTQQNINSKYCRPQEKKTNTMVNLVLFETSESIIELLWDIALAFFIVRLAFIYFMLTFTSGAAITYLAYNYPEFLPLLAPVLLLLSALCAYVVVLLYEIPRAMGFRLATGAVALVFMLLAEAMVGLGLWEGGYGKWISERVGLGFGALLAAFALMPFILMAFERKPKGERELKTSHRHEKKSIVDAV
jgi:hypothetical protein